jgi:hypothetical protein
MMVLTFEHYHIETARSIDGRHAQIRFETVIAE